MICKIVFFLLSLSSLLCYNVNAQDKKSKTVFLESINESTPRTEPEYKGGMKAFWKYVSKSIIIPDLGTSASFNVIASYIIEKDGTVSTVEITEGYNEKFDNKLIEVLQRCKRWKPATLDGKPTRVQMSFPLTINTKYGE